MANIVITSGTTSIMIDNGVYSGVSGPYGIIQKKISLPKNMIGRISLAPDESIVVVDFRVSIGVSIPLSYSSTTGALIVDLIDGAAPTNNADLFSKLSALI